MLNAGESLIESWLKHVNNCQVVQKNWKASKSWETISDKEIERLLKKLDKKFKILGENTSEQFFSQGEIDCLGVSLKLDEDLKLSFNKIFAVEIAFHEKGLNYSGGLDANILKLKQKLIRNALSIHKYFGIKNKVEIIFATPKTVNTHTVKLREVIEQIIAEFSLLGFEYSFKLFTDEDFNDKILQKVINKVDNISDDSEFFIRSLKLANIFNKKVIEKSVKVNIPMEYSEITEIGVGARVIEIFEKLEAEQRLSAEEISNLCSKEYSNSIFKINFPLLVEYKDGSEAFVNNYRRYYVQTFKLGGNEYFLCSQWYDKNRPYLEKWFQKVTKK
jgi:hypothetical protein